VTFIIFIYYVYAFSYKNTGDGDTKGDDWKMEGKRQGKQVVIPEFPSACSC
jgi:hypothetical protein